MHPLDESMHHSSASIDHFDESTELPDESLSDPSDSTEERNESMGDPDESMHGSCGSMRISLGAPTRVSAPLVHRSATAERANAHHTDMYTTNVRPDDAAAVAVAQPSLSDGR